MKICMFLVTAALLSFSSVCCSHVKSNREEHQDLDFEPETQSKSADSPKPAPARSLTAAETKTLEKMNTAMEDYVFRRDSKALTQYCQDLRFDCFVDNKAFPDKRKKQTRKNAPLATGSKFGLQGEDRVQVRYEFFP